MAGHQIWGLDSLGTLSVINSTTLELSESTVTLGGLQYDTLPLQIETFVSGIGGLDIGSVAADTMYSVYLVLDSGDVALVASTNHSSPIGFSIFVKAGTFSTDSGAAVKTTNIKVPIVKKLTSSGIYNAPNGVKYLKVSAVAGGGGGGGSSNNGTNNPNPGAAGGSTTFGSLFTLAGGGGGTTSTGGAGGIPTINDIVNFTVLKVLNGGSGTISHTIINAGGVIAGGKGGDSILGTAKPAGLSNASNADANSGTGGRGGGSDYSAGYYYSPGGGGGAGAGVVGIVSKPTGSYSYTIGSGGAGGGGQVYNGGAGGSGVIIIEEYYE